MFAMMPIASGASGRVDAGAEQPHKTATTWTLGGIKQKETLSSKSCDSYLQRFLEIQRFKKNKVHLTQESSGNTQSCDQEAEGTTNGGQAANGVAQKEQSREKPTEEKKSSFCVLL